MALKSYIGSSFDTVGEELIYEKLLALYEKINHLAYLVYDVPINFDKKYEAAKPDFILIDEKYGICIIEVKDWNVHTFKSMSTINFEKINGEYLDNPMQKADYYFNVLNNLLKKNFSSWNNSFVKSNLILTKFKKTEEFSSLAKKSGRMSKTFFADEIQDLSLECLYQNNPIHIGRELAQFSLTIIRPEIYVGRIVEFNGANIENRKEEIHLLDEKQQSVVNFPDVGHFLVSGLPGSGKTITVLARAFKLLERNPDWNILITCFNRPLAEKIQQMADQRRHLLDSHAYANNTRIRGNVKVRNFHGLCYDIVNKRFEDYSGEDPEKQMVVEVLSKATPMYDAVLVDEYQDFSDLWLSIIKKIARKHSRAGKGNIESVFLSGDKLQQVRGPEEAKTWSERGFEISGRSRFLNICYRSCSNHLKLALEFLGKDAWNSYKSLHLEETIKDVDYDLIKSHGILEFRQGDTFELKLLLENMLSKGMPANEIMVIAMPHRVAELKRELSSYSKKGILFESHGRCKGLESPVVILFNADFFEPKELSEQNKRRNIYMCLTRSNFALYIMARDMNTSYAKELFLIFENMDLKAAI